LDQSGSSGPYSDRRDVTLPDCGRHARSRDRSTGT
jgi:hypothetical protein